MENNSKQQLDSSWETPKCQITPFNFSNEDFATLPSWARDTISYHKNRHKEYKKCTKMITVPVYNDPGHAWGKVSRKTLKKYELENLISSYSYQSKDRKWVFLEEDSDLSLFINRLRQNFKTIVVCRDFYTNNQSKIRNYPSFVPENLSKDFS